MKRHEAMRIIMKKTIISLVVFATMFVVGAVPNAQARQCSNASLKGAYGFFYSFTLVPAGTPAATLGRWNFDGQGNFTNTVTRNDNGMVIHFNDFGPYTVNTDCTGEIGIGQGTGTIEIVLVDGGKEFYGILTDPSSIVSVFTANKKQFPDDDDDNEER